MTNLESGKEIVAVARNLSLLGCFVATVTPFVTGTKVRLRITHRARHSQPLVGWPMPQPPREWGLRLAKLKLKTERSSTLGWVRTKFECAKALGELTRILG